MIGVNIGRGAATRGRRGDCRLPRGVPARRPVADYWPSTSARRTRRACATCSSRIGCASCCDAARGRQHERGRPATAGQAGARPGARCLRGAGRHRGPRTREGLILTIRPSPATGRHRSERHEIGGLSGAPLRDRMLDSVGRARALMAHRADHRLGRHRLRPDAATPTQPAPTWSAVDGSRYRGPGLIGEAGAVRPRLALIPFPPSSQGRGQDAPLRSEFGTDDPRDPPAAAARDCRRRASSPSCRDHVPGPHRSAMTPSPAPA